MSLQGLHDCLADTEISSLEILNDVALEVEENQPDVWDTIPIETPKGVEEQVPSPTSPAVDSYFLSSQLQETIAGVSVEVAEGTDVSYRRYMKRFDTWLQVNNHIKPDETIFRDDLPESTPQLIAAYIMDQCDIMKPDGSQKVEGVGEAPRTFSHAMKLRSALTYGFGQHHRRGTREWSLNLATQRWEGNPSVSVVVSRYMLSLRKRKHKSGDIYAQSSRALTSSILRRLYQFNNEEDRCNIELLKPVDKLSAPQWGNPRRRLLVHAVLTMAFVCLLRIDEVLNLRFEDVQFHQVDHIEVTLHSRKTHQFGSKPYHLWVFDKEDQALCPTTALSRWIEASGFGHMRTGYIFRSVNLDGKPPSVFKDQPITSAAFIELFRNNLVDIGVDPSMYAGHSCRRGGCQWLIRERRWPILRVCDWGGWSTDFSHATIIRYLISWNDDPYEPREDYLNPNRKPNIRCTTCGRTCWCGF